jgi:hypothetical protein
MVRHVHFRDHHAQAHAADLTQEGTKLRMFPGLLQGREVRLDPQACDGSAFGELPLEKGQHHPALRFRLGEGIFQAHFVEDQDGSRIENGRPAEGRRKIVGPESCEETRLAQPIAASMRGFERFVDHIPGVQPAGIAGDGRVEMPEGGFGELGGRTVAMGGRNGFVPPERMAVEGEAVLCREGDELVGSRIIGLPGVLQDCVPLHLVFRRNEVAISKNSAVKRLQGKVGGVLIFTWS